MKRISLLIIIAILYCCCTTNGSDGQDNESGVAPMDSVVEASDSEVVELELESPFTSQDLKWQQLHGHVKQVKYKYENGDDTYRFDVQGNFITNHNSYSYPHKVKRNNRGQIVEWHLWMDETDFYYDEEYQYNDEGYICKLSNSSEADEEEYTYVLNEKGWPISATWKYEDGEMGDEEVTHYKGTASFSYPQIDEQGNWLKRVEKLKFRNVKGGKTKTSTYTTTRKITYWE